MKTPAKKKRTSGWRLASDPPKDEKWRIVCHDRVGWIGRGYYARGEWRDGAYGALIITHWHNYPKLPKDED